MAARRHPGTARRGKARLTNIPSEQVAIRLSICAAIGVPPETMPFAGELLQVRETDWGWEGAVERLLHNFGLSLLVPDEHYAAVAAWVDKTRLRGRLVYFRVRENARGEVRSTHRDSVVRKLAIKADSSFCDWVKRELSARFDVACCATQEQFRRETRAITRAGQIKGAERHETHDRHRLDDRNREQEHYSDSVGKSGGQKERQTRGHSSSHLRGQSLCLDVVITTDQGMVGYALKVQRLCCFSADDPELCCMQQQPTAGARILCRLE